MTKNDIIELSITAISSDGQGVGRYDGMAVFVPFSAVGDVLQCRVLKVQKKCTYAKIERIITASSDRIKPDCDVFGRCGGCCFRHISYEAELRAKKNFVRDAFERLAGLNVPFEKIIAAPSPERYRNKAQMPVSDADGRPVCGFYSPRSHRVIPCGDCRLSPEIFSEICDEILNYQRQKRLSCYDEESGRGLLRHIYLRRGHYSGEISVCLVVSKITGEYDSLAEKLCEKFPDIKTVVLNVNPKNTNVILNDKEIVLAGDGMIRDRICGVETELSAKSFYQVNTPAAEAVYRKAAEYAALSGSETLLDLYCGAGTVGLSMASRAARLIGVEAVPEAVVNARENAKRNGVKNAVFIAADAGKAANDLAKSGEHPDVVVVDPPRKGCSSETLDAIVKMAPKRVVMISCDPATAARDIKYLSERGYTPEKACPADMFPRTRHVETVIKLS